MRVDGLGRSKVNHDRSIANVVRRVFRLKELVHRDRAAQFFYRHCLQEGWTLAAAVSAALNDWSAEVLGQFSATGWSEVLDRSVGPFTSDKSLNAHCQAIATELGLRAMRGNIDPACQERGVAWAVHRLIIANEVGEENVGQARSPWSAGAHISWRPGTFTGGAISAQQTLVRLYERMPAAHNQLVLLLVSLGAVSPSAGIEKAIFRYDDMGAGMMSGYRVGTATPEQPITEWDKDFVITDAAAALSELPKSLVDRLKSAIESVNPFWPEFSARHRLRW
jgi:hypothetical protein